MSDHTPSIDDIKEWNRNTVADGNWLNARTIIPIKQCLSAISGKVDELDVGVVTTPSEMYEAGNEEKLAQVQAITGIVRIDNDDPHKLVVGF